MDWKMFVLHNEVHYREAIEKSVANSKIYDHVENTVTRKQSTIVEVIDMKTLDAVVRYREGKTCVLNFASFKNPGGGFLKGAVAQEEYLCQNSTLYNVLSKFPAYYEKNRLNTNNALYWNKAIYTPGIIVLPSETKVDVLSCAAPNVRASHASDTKKTKALVSRIKFVLDILEKVECDTIILGAFGCGVFGNDPKLVAETFKRQRVLQRGFSKVIFAIPNELSVNHHAFKEVYNDI
jgi:uncharacterized protein (TIGR02452 family)